MLRQQDVYLVDFEAYRPPDELNLSMTYEEQLEIASKVSQRSGVLISRGSHRTPVFDAKGHFGHNRPHVIHFTKATCIWPWRSTYLPISTQFSDQETLDFYMTVLQRSAISQESFLAPAGRRESLVACLPVGC